MKVAFLTTSFPEKGHESRGPFIKHLYDHLIREKVHIELVLPKGYHSLKDQGGIFPALKGNIINKILFCAYTFHFLTLIPLKARTTDIIHANWSYTAFLALITKPLHRKKILLTERGPEIVYTKNPIIKHVVRFVYTHVDTLVTISSSIAADITSIYHIKNVLVIPNGVDRNSFPEGKEQLRKKFNIPLNQFVFLSAGRLIKRKAIDQLLPIFKEISTGDLYIVGDGPERASLERLAQSLDITSRVHFVGEILPADVFQWMHAADVFVFPSSMETGGNVLLEAVASGLPIITTNVGWAHDVVLPGKNGFIVHPYDSLAFTQAMQTFLKNKTLQKKFSNASIHMIKNNFKWEQCAKNYIKAYTTLLSQPL